MALLPWISGVVATACVAASVPTGQSNLTVYPNPAYAGDCITFSCSKPSECGDATKIVVNSTSAVHVVSCFVLSEIANLSTGLSGCSGGNGSPSCYKNPANVSVVVISVNASMSLNRTYLCKPELWTGEVICESKQVELVIFEEPDRPRLSIVSGTYNEGDPAKISCNSSKGVPAPRMKLTVTKNGRDLIVPQIGEYSVTTLEYFTYEWHGAIVSCNVVNHDRRGMNVTEQVKVNFIRLVDGVKEVWLSVYINGTNTHNKLVTLNCGSRIESNPPAYLSWSESHNLSLPSSQLTAENNSAIEIDSSQPHLYKCVATNAVTNVSLTITFHVTDHGDADDQATPADNRKGISDVIIAGVASAVCVTCTVIIVIIVVCCRKRYSGCRGKKSAANRSGDPSSRYGGTADEDEMAMQDNVLYESAPMAGAPLHVAETQPLWPCINRCESLIVASEALVGDLEENTLGKSLIVTYSDQRERSNEILGKIESLLSTNYKPKNLALLLRSNYNGLLLTKPDKLIINSKNASSNEGLRDFFTKLVSRCLDVSSDEGRIDLLNCTKLSAVERNAIAEALNLLVEVPVTLSFDIYGASTRVDSDRTVADLYFNHTSTGEVVYAEIELPKDVQRAPRREGDRVVYSEMRT